MARVTQVRHLSVSINNWIATCFAFDYLLSDRPINPTYVIMKSKTSPITIYFFTKAMTEYAFTLAWKLFRSR